MEPIYKRVKTIQPHCPICEKMLRGNGSVMLPYTCSCGEWKYDITNKKYKIEKLNDH